MDPSSTSTDEFIDSALDMVGKWLLHEGISGIVILTFVLIFVASFIKGLKAAGKKATAAAAEHAAKLAEEARKLELDRERERHTESMQNKLRKAREDSEINAQNNDLVIPTVSLDNLGGATGSTENKVAAKENLNNFVDLLQTSYSEHANGGIPKTKDDLYNLGNSMANDVFSQYQSSSNVFSTSENAVEDNEEKKPQDSSSPFGQYL